MRDVYAPTMSEKTSEGVSSLQEGARNIWRESDVLVIQPGSRLGQPKESQNSSSFTDGWE
jgi:hypothetical protein